MDTLLFYFPALASIRDFIELGGPVLYLIGFVLLVMWALIFERIFYLNFRHKKNVKNAVGIWNARKDRGSWNAHQIRERLISVVSSGLDKRIDLIQTLVALCPLLGLLGTVTGMIEVFGAMAGTDSGSARSMAAGVAKATVPTMAGMVAAISGLGFGSYLLRKANAEREELAEHMELTDWEGY